MDTPQDIARDEYLDSLLEMLYRRKITLSAVKTYIEDPVTRMVGPLVHVIHYVLGEIGLMIDEPEANLLLWYEEYLQNKSF